MELRSIQYFVQIAELGSITRAAEHLRVAQPALTRHIQSLEQQLHAQLLVRLPRGVRLTGAGRQFLERCRRIQRELDHAREEVRHGTDTPAGRVVLGVSPTVAPMLVPGCIERVARQCPQVSLKIIEGFSGQLYDALLSGRLDVAILTNPSPSRALRLIPLISEPIVVVTSPQQRGTRKSFTLEELAGTPLVVTEGLRALVEEQLARQGVRLNVCAEVDAVEAIRRLVCRGAGTTLMPVSAFHDDIASGQVAAYQIADTALQRMLVLASPADHKPSAAAEEISHIVRAEVDSQADNGWFSITADVGRLREPVATSRKRRAARH